MPQKWHQKATVQAALIGGSGLVLAAVITGMFSVWKTSKPELPNERQEPDLIQPNSLNLKSGHLKLNPKDGLEYVWILPDTFQMGCVPDDTQCAEDEKPRHPVEITKGFWMSSTEVTVGAYKRFCGHEPPDA